MRNNNFDLLRLAAAFAVLVSHSVPISYGSNDAEAIWRVSRQQATLGDLSVAVFFILSGYLVCKSWQDRPDFARFVVARALRLLPALAVMLAVTVFLMGPMLTTYSTRQYLSNAKTVDYFWGNLSLTSFTAGVPGIFNHNPLPGVMNGSLWTLPIEALCYGMILGLGLAGLLNRWLLLTVWAAGCVATVLWWGGPVVRFGTMFLAGSVLLAWQVPMRPRLAWISVAVLALAFVTSGLRLALPTAGAYLVLYAGIAIAPIRLRPQGDLSYGVYLWAFPIQQAVTQFLGPNAGAPLNVLISLPIVTGFAWMSWHWVERPALYLRSRYGARYRTG